MSSEKKFKILVTGCAGFIGSHLCEKLLKNPNNQVIGLDIINDYYNVKQKEANLQILKKYPNFVFFKEDITTTKCIETYKPDKVCHLASMAGVRYSLDNPMIYCHTNIGGQINLLEQSVKNGVKLFVYASSSSVYGMNTKVPFSETDTIELPNSSYACSKQAMETYANYYHRLYGLPVIGLRFFTVYGPRGRPDMAPYKFIKNIMNGLSITKYGDGETYRDYTYVADIVDGIIASLDNNTNKKCEVYNLGNNTPISLNKFIETCEDITSKKAIIQQMDEQKGDVSKTWADIDKAQKDLGYQPKVALKEGLNQLYLWLKETSF